VLQKDGEGLLLALGITLIMMIAEIIGGLLSNSLALLSDAGHMSQMRWRSRSPSLP